MNKRFCGFSFLICFKNLIKNQKKKYLPQPLWLKGPKENTGLEKSSISCSLGSLGIGCSVKGNENLNIKLTLKMCSQVFKVHKIHNLTCLNKQETQDRSPMAI